MERETEKSSHPEPKKALSEIGEFGFIRRFAGKFDSLLPSSGTGIGDDCAILPADENSDFVISTDLLVEDVHFLRDQISPWQLGYKSLAVNLSDIAAMGADPVASFLSLALPADTPVTYLDKFMEGYHALSEKYKVPLMGGDTTKSTGKLTINVCVIGRIAKGRARLRSMAKEGDIICVSGNLGNSGGGLNLILEKAPREGINEFLMNCHNQPEPSLPEGQWLAQTAGVHAMMDISDGIASDLNHILKASGKAATVTLEHIPVSEELKEAAKEHQWDYLQLAISGGEDYELLFTVNPAMYPKIEKDYRRHFGKALTPIGVITQGAPAISWEHEGNPVVPDSKGFKHF